MRPGVSTSLSIGAHLQTVDGETSSRVGCSVLQLCNDRVMNVLLLFTQKLCADSVECVAPELVVALHDLQNVQLQPAFHVDRFRIPLPVSFGREVGILDLGFDAY